MGGPGNASSSNWAGYAVTAPGAPFSDVKARWVQPTVTCLGSHSASSSFWVGLGGFGSGSRALEQTGTEADCSPGGIPTYSGWYELLPAQPVPIPLRVAPSDTIAADVSVTGTTVAFRLDDLTTVNGFATEATIAAPDLSSAEWIAEAPSDCNPFNRNGCSIVPLANFGTIAITAASAQTADHTGPISDPAWTADGLDLTTASGAHAASTSPLSADGTTFTVTWQSSGGPLELTTLGFDTTPGTPVGSRPFTVTMTVGATDPTALTQASTTCRATVGSHSLRAQRRSFKNSRASCRWLLPATAKGKTLRGTITASARNARTARSFTTTIH